MHYYRIALHRRFKTPHHCRILNRHKHTDSDEGQLSLLVPTNRQCSSTSLPVLYTTQQSSVPPTLPVHETIRQCNLEHHCRFVTQAGSAILAITAGLLLTGSDGPFAFYCFIIYFNLYFLWNQVLLYIRYVDDRSINIKHYKCYG